MPCSVVDLGGKVCRLCESGHAFSLPKNVQQVIGYCVSSKLLRRFDQKKGSPEQPVNLLITFNSLSI